MYACVSMYVEEEINACARAPLSALLVDYLPNYVPDEPRPDCPSPRALVGAKRGPEVPQVTIGMRRRSRYAYCRAGRGEGRARGDDGIHVSAGSGAGR